MILSGREELEKELQIVLAKAFQLRDNELIKVANTIIDEINFLKARTGEAPSGHYGFYGVKLSVKNDSSNTSF